MGDLALAALGVRLDVRDALTRYCNAIDRRKFASALPCFHEDSMLHYGGYQGGPEGLLAYFESVADTVENMMHMLGHSAFSAVPGDEDAYDVETYCTFFRRTVGQPPEQASTGTLRYLDRFTLRGGHWAIAERRIVLDVEMRGSAPIQTPTDFLV